MNTIAESIRVLADTLQPGHFDPVVRIEPKSHYGNPPLNYVTSHHKDALYALTGTKTLTQKHIDALKALGFAPYDEAKKRHI